MQQYLNNWQSTLLAGVSAAETSAQIPAGDAAKLSLSGADYYVMTLEAAGAREIVHITAVSGQTLTLLRGQEGTTAQAWSTGTGIEMRVTAAALTRHEQATGGGTNLSVTRTATTVTVANSSGDDAVLPEATGTQAGVLSAAGQAKLDGLDGALAGKQNTEAGKGLSSNDYTTTEKNKLAAIAAGAEVNHAAVSQAEAEGGTSTSLRSWSPLRVWQAIGAWWAASAMKTKLDGIATGATANQTDAHLLNRANHTGTQATSTVTGLDTALASKQPVAAVLTESGQARTLALTDNLCLIDCTSSSAATITIPPQASVAWPANAEIHVRRSGTGAVSIAAGAGVTFPPAASPFALGAQGAVVTLKRLAQDVWAVIGGDAVTVTDFAKTLLDDTTQAQMISTLNAVSRSAIVGTVSQSGGVPTGAIIERGSNANGDYTKWADGTMICAGTKAMPQWLANSDVTASALFAAVFVGLPRVVPILLTSYPSLVSATAAAISSAEVTLSAGGHAQAQGDVYYIAFGRWF